MESTKKPTRNAVEQHKKPEGNVLIAHAADIHLRHTQYATARRGLDFFAAFMRAVEAAAEAVPRPDCMVVAGDIFDNARPGPLLISQLMRIDARAKELKLPILAGTGNHDYSVPTWLSTLFPAAKLDQGGVYPIDGESVEINGITIYGIPPYSTTAFRERTAEIEAATRGADVIVYHNLIEGITPLYVGEKNVLNVSELPVHARTKAILLGDIHIPQYIYRDKAAGASCLIGYPGSLEMCSAGEPPEKALPLIRVTATGAAVERVIPLKTRTFISARVTTAVELDALVDDVRTVAGDHPLVTVEFDRSIPQTVSRLHALLDTEQAVLRCSPLPMKATAAKREEDAAGGERLTLNSFIAKRFEARPDLAECAEALLVRGETDAANIITEFIDSKENNITASFE